MTTANLYDKTKLQSLCSAWISNGTCKCGVISESFKSHQRYGDGKNMEKSMPTFTETPFSRET